MLDNHAYNLMSQIVEDHRSLWRMRDVYGNDSGECQKCRDLWRKLADNREAELNEMVELLREHMA